MNGPTQASAMSEKWLTAPLSELNSGTMAAP